MTSTGRCACTTTAYDTLPRSADWTRDRPRAPTTIGSASSLPASSQIACQLLPAVLRWPIRADDRARWRELPAGQMVTASWSNAARSRWRAGTSQRTRPGRRARTGPGRRSGAAPIAFTERLAAAGVSASVGTVGDAYDNALAESVIGLFKTELIKPRGPWRTPDTRARFSSRWSVSSGLVPALCCPRSWRGRCTAVSTQSRFCGAPWPLRTNSLLMGPRYLTPSACWPA
jgi:hypothetical protein